MQNYVAGMRTRSRSSASAQQAQGINNAANLPPIEQQELKRNAAHMGKRGSEDSANRTDASMEGGIKKNRTAFADISNTTQSQPAKVAPEHRLEASAGPVTRSRASLGGTTGRGTARNLVNAFSPERKFTLCGFAFRECLRVRRLNFVSTCVLQFLLQLGAMLMLLIAMIHSSALNMSTTSMLSCVRRRYA